MDLSLGRRLSGLAVATGAAVVTPLTLLWERTAPLSPVEHDYLARVLDGLSDATMGPYLGAHWDVCRQVLGPANRGCVMHRPDLHVVQTATGVVIEV